MDRLRDVRLKLSPDDEIRAFARAYLVRDDALDDFGIVSITDVEALLGIKLGRGTCQGMQILDRDMLAMLDHKAAQWAVVVSRHVSPLANLPEGHKGQDIVRLALLVQQWNGRKQVNIHDRSHQHFKMWISVAIEDGEGRVGAGSDAGKE